MKFAVAAGGLLAAATLVLGGGVAEAQTSQPPPPGGGQLTQQDQTFMMENAQVNLAEIDAGQLAAHQATSPAVRQTALTIANDHQQALGQLRSLAQQLGVTLPEEPNGTQQQQATQLQSVSGRPDFDRTYLQMQVTGHQQAISQTQQEISSGSDPDVQQFARTILPVLEKHLQMAQTDLAQLGRTPSGVPAGTGGTAAPWASGMLVGGLTGAGSLLILAAMVLLLLRRRRA